MLKACCGAETIVIVYIILMSFCPAPGVGPPLLIQLLQLSVGRVRRRPPRMRPLRSATALSGLNQKSKLKFVYESNISKKSKNSRNPYDFFEILKSLQIIEFHI